MKKRLFFLLICLFPVMSVFLSAQTAMEIEELLGNKAVSYGQAVSFVLKAAELSNPADPADPMDPMDPAEAFSFAADRNWLPRTAAPDDTVRLDGLSLLIMRSFDIKGGLLYSLTKSPHYAYREMVYQDMIQGRADPAMAVSGELLLFLVNRALSLQVGGDGPVLQPVSAPEDQG